MTSPTTTLTRTCSLIPREPDKKGIYQFIKERMLSFRVLENTYIDVLITSLKNGPLTKSDFSGESKAHVKRQVYNTLKLNEIYSTFPAKLKLKERMLRCAIQYPYFAVRKWLVRTHYLSVIIKELTGLISSSPRHAVRFLQGSSMAHSAMKRLSTATRKNCFGKTFQLSYLYITNLIGQVRNLFISSTRIEPILKARLIEILSNPALVEEVLESALSSFTRKKKGTLEKVPISDIFEHFFKRYLMRVKRQSTWNAKHVLNLSDMAGFKREREYTFQPLIKELQASLEVESVNSLYELARKVFQEVINEHLMTPQVSLTKHIFKPVLRAPRVSIIPTREGFIEYFTQVVKNQVNLTLKNVFLTTSLINGLMSELAHLDASLHTVVNPPRIRHLALPINQAEQVYDVNFSRLEVKLSFISREKFMLNVKDEKGRVKILIERGATPCLPVLTMKGRKLLLHLPLELKSSDLSKQPPLDSDSIKEKKRVEIGVDLGLKHPAVLSVMDRTTPNVPVELARYFIGMHTLLDMKFNIKSGTFEPQARFNNSHSSKKSNQKLKLRNMRHEARNLQRKVHKYENHLSERSTANPSRKYKHYRLSQILSHLWEHVNHVNKELVRQLQHMILEIAVYHGASVLKFENLKWSQHSKKSETGAYFAFWQAHWFFSQVQQAVELQANLNGITFRRISAAYTSHDCWSCRMRGMRNGRSFMCMNSKYHASGKAIRVHSDLNAARVIAIS